MTIAGFAPADAAAHINPLTAIAITLSGAIDPDSVSTRSVHVWFGASKRPVRGLTNYDIASHAIYFVPFAALDYNTEFRVTVDGVTAGGAAIPAGTATFRTLVNPETEMVEYSATGAAVARHVFERDADGQRTAQVDFDPGADRAVGTADDAIVAWTAVLHPSATVTRTIRYSAPGADAVWRTADDTIAGVADDTTDPARAAVVRTVNYRDAGADGVWLTDDDAVDSVTEDTLTADDRLARSVTTNAGADGQPGTADDRIFLSIVASYPASAPESYADRVLYADPGPDGVWATADDRSLLWQRTEFDPFGQVVSLATFETGADGAFHTADDVQTGLVRFEIAAALPRSSSTVRSAGPDGAWGTDDDVIDSYRQTVYMGRARASLHEYSTGPDGVLQTADDHPTLTTTYDPSL